MATVIPNNYIFLLFRIQQERREVCQKSLERSREVRESQSHMYARLKPLFPSKASPAHSCNTTDSVAGSKPSPTRSKTTGSVPGRSVRVQAAEALATRDGIDRFEAELSLRSEPMETRPYSTGSIGEGTAMTKVERVIFILY